MVYCEALKLLGYDLGICCCPLEILMYALLGFLDLVDSQLLDHYTYVAMLYVDLPPLGMTSD